MNPDQHPVATAREQLFRLPPGASPVDGILHLCSGFRHDVHGDERIRRVDLETEALRRDSAEKRVSIPLFPLRGEKSGGKFRRNPIGFPGFAVGVELLRHFAPHRDEGRPAPFGLQIVEVPVVVRMNAERLPG